MKRDWSTGAEDLFVTARGAHRPGAADRERVRRAIASKIVAAGAGAAVGVGVAGATTKAATKGLVLGLLAKLGVPVLLVAGAAGTAAVLSSPSPGGASESGAEVAPGHAPAPRAIPRALQPASPRSIATAPLHVDRVEPVAPAQAPAPLRAPAPRDDSAEELALVRAMETALRGGDFAEASRLAREHERRFPNGVLQQERAGASAIAACRTGHPAAGAAFLQAYPSSPLAARVRVACGVTESEASGQ